MLTNLEDARYNRRSEEIMGVIKKALFNEKVDISSKDREKVGIIAGIIGIISNLFLAIIKLFLGLATNSVSMLADATNNISDTLSSTVMIFGFWLAKRPADSEHPHGHARYEYISGLFISLSILFIGVEFLQVSVGKILNPSELKLNIFWLLLLFITILVKVAQCIFNYRVGKSIQSLPLIATAEDSFSDVLITTVVMISAIIEYYSSWKVDGYAGMLVACFILFSGIKSLLATIDELLGKMPDMKEIKRIEAKLSEFNEVLGFHDLALHSYGPNKTYVTVHAEIDANMDLLLAHGIIDRIEEEFLRELGIQLLIHIDPVITDDKEYCKLVKQIEKIVQTADKDLSIHDIRISFHNNIPNFIFDLVVKEGSSGSEMKEIVLGEIKKSFPDSKIIIYLDYNYIDLNIEKQ